MRMGFAVKVLGEGGIKETDARRWQSGPHLRESLASVKNVLEYCNRHDLRFYRMSSDLAPYLTHPDLPQFHGQLEESADDLKAVGDLAKQYDIRLTTHPPQYIVLNAQDESIAEKSRQDFIAQAQMFDMMGLGEGSVMITHVGGAYGDKDAGKKRFAERFLALPEATRARLVVENDDVTYSAQDALDVSAMCGVRVVFDNLHHFCNNPERLPLRDALEQALATWPADQTPKTHYSSPRTESVEQARKAGKSGTMQTYQAAPDNRLHADYVNPFEFRYFLEKVSGLRDFDVMFESKAKDLAVLRLRKEFDKNGMGPL